ncbi:MAG TPA: PfkB family carbohydrate kinase [Kofleriaceae bacterium]|nr:PfkB family carbohydrate kinase [Kofleriaceae bacterium]
MNRAELALCWGEILWDRFPDGARLGGAPANVAYHLGALGGRVALASRVGDDRPGHDAIAAMAARGVDTALIQLDPDRPTGAVEVSIDSEGNASYRLNRGGAWEHIAWSSEIAAALAGAGAFCYGTFSQRTPAGRQALRDAIAAAPEACLRVCDPNLRPSGVDPDVLRESLVAATVVKINEREEQQLRTTLGAADPIAWLLAGGARVVALTRGAFGSRLITVDGEHDCPGFPAQAGGDTVGAGDAYLATLVHMLLRGQAIDTINEVACRVGSFVASRRGATPGLPEELIRAANG